MADMTIQDKLVRLGENEERLDTFVNGMEPYTTNTSPAREVESLPAFIERIKCRYLTPMQRGVWQPNTAYGLNDVVKRPDLLYICAEPHTSSADFATDVAAQRWGLFPSEGTIVPAKEDVAGVGFAASPAEASAGKTDIARAEYHAFVTPEGVAAAIEKNKPESASVSAPGIVALAVLSDITKEPPDNKKAATAAVVKDYAAMKHAEVMDVIAGYATKEYVENTVASVPALLSRSVTFTESGTWTVPEDCVVFIEAIAGSGGGGGGGGGNPSASGAKGGVGSGGAVGSRCLILKKNAVVSFTIGAGGNGGNGGAGSAQISTAGGGGGGSLGGTTTVKVASTDIITVPGGAGGGGGGAPSTNAGGVGGGLMGGAAGSVGGSGGNAGLICAIAFGTTPGGAGGGIKTSGSAGTKGLSGNVIIYY